MDACCIMRESVSKISSNWPRDGHGRCAYRVQKFLWSMEGISIGSWIFHGAWKVCLSIPVFFGEHGRCVYCLMDFFMEHRSTRLQDFHWATKVFLSTSEFFWRMEGMSIGSWIFLVHGRYEDLLQNFLWSMQGVSIDSRTFVEHGRFFHRILDFWGAWKICISSPGIFVEHGRYVYRLLNFLWSMEGV